MVQARPTLVAVLMIAAASFGSPRAEAADEVQTNAVAQAPAAPGSAESLRKPLSPEERLRLEVEAMHSPERLEYAERRNRELREAALRQPEDDMLAFPRDRQKAPSAWRSSEKAFFGNLLANGRFDVLVVPFQVQQFAINRTARSLMTAELALAIGAAQKRVPDPYLVARALGDGERRFDLKEVYRLAEKLGVSRVVLGYVGHLRNKKMRFTIQYQDKGPVFWSAAVVSHITHFDDLPFSDEDPPIEVYRRLLPRVLAAIGVNPAPAGSSRPTSRFDSTELPLSPLRMISDRAEPARDAYYLQLLAALTPRYAARLRERLIERSFLATRGMQPKSPDYPVLTARALMYMGLRQAALRTLGTPVSAEQKHLFAVLNGNLPDSERYAAQIKPGVRAVIARLETNDVASAYGVRTRKKALEDAEGMTLPGDVWPVLAARAMTEWDAWSQYENIQLKALLDREFPISSFTVESIARGAASLGDMSKVRVTIDLSVLDHARRLLVTQATTLCCAPLAARVNALDYLDLIESMGTDNLMRRAHFLTYIQGAHEPALEFLARIEGAYKDHPQFALNRARAEAQLAQRADGMRKEGLRKSAYEQAFNAMYWEQGQTRTAAEAFELKVSVAREKDEDHDNFFASDYPFRSFYPTWEFGTIWFLPRSKEDYGGDQGEQILLNEYAALRNSTVDFGPVSNLSYALGELRGKWEDVDQVLKSIEDRFVGHPERAQVMAQNSARKGDVQAAKRYYREGIESQPGQWQPYMDLGKLLYEEGNVAEAAQTLMSYPGFAKSSDENSIAVSNLAFDAGSPFYWSGNFEQAMPLYRIAAELKTGSNGSMSSEIRIRLVDGDFVAALTELQDLARRYNSPAVYRDYLGMMHAMEHSKEAWDGFNVLVGQFDTPELWETAIVGHRLAGATESEVAAWAAQEPVRSAGRVYGYAAMYLLRAGVTDRLPTGELASSIAAIERPVWKSADGRGPVFRASLDGKIQTILSPAASHSGTTVSSAHGTGQRIRVKSDLVYFAEAYRAIRNGDFAAAKALLAEASTLYDLAENPTLSYLLPYYVFAAAGAGDAGLVAAYLDKIPSKHRRFDYYLARAAIAGIAGKTDETLESLTLARHRPPITEIRPVSAEYAYAELCEWLYEATRNTKYRDAALGWAKKIQARSPWFSWPYAMEARLSTDVNERGRAIAMAHYLDRKSERLAAIPKSEIDAAVREFGARNPFLAPNTFSKKDSI